MERHALRVIVVLGLLVSLVTGAGVFAEFADRATAGPNSVETVALPRVADIQLAEASVDAAGLFTCGEFKEDLSTALFSAVLGANVALPGATLCVRNAGSAYAGLAMSAIDLVDIEIDCTGDEAAFDSTCSANSAGELSPRLLTSVYVTYCVDSGGYPAGAAGLAGMASGARIQIAEQNLSLAPGEQRCLYVYLGYGNGSLQENQAAQSDRATWRYAFDATVPDSAVQ